MKYRARGASHIEFACHMAFHPVYVGCWAAALRGDHGGDMTQLVPTGNGCFVTLASVHLPTNHNKKWEWRWSYPPCQPYRHVGLQCAL